MYVYVYGVNWVMGTQLIRGRKMEEITGVCKFRVFVDGYDDLTAVAMF